MKLYAKHLFLTAIILSLFGCTTLETYIENGEDTYRMIPIEKKGRFIFGEEFVMENYRLVYNGNTSSQGNNYEETTRKYTFYKGAVPLYGVEITKSEEKGVLSAIIGLVGIKRCIKIVYATGIKIEYPINNESSYITFQDESITALDITYYQSRNKNDLEHDWTYTTGFNATLNGEAYGIISFYPGALYLKHEHTVQDKIMLYILSAYASYVYKN
ncbi:MAG: hypothetical protein LBK63_01800 [Treponema sp.]|jgi:hypothetical protein|nr:hypothetical protein [Treponema sp.]